MLEKYSTLLSMIPFAGLLGHKPNKGRPMTTRIIEQALVGIVSALATISSMQARSDEKIDQLSAQIKAQRAEGRDDIRELRDAIAEIWRENSRQERQKKQKEK